MISGLVQLVQWKPFYIVTFLKQSNVYLSALLLAACLYQFKTLQPVLVKKKLLFLDLFDLFLEGLKHLKYPAFHKEKSED